MSITNFKRVERVDRLRSGGKDKENRSREEMNGRTIKSINKQYKINVTQRERIRENAL